MPVIKNLLWVASLLVPGSGRKNVKNPVFARLFGGAFTALLLLRLVSPKTHRDSGTGFFLKSRTGNYFKTHFLPVSPVGVF